jgi:hypothetical protein
MMIIIQTFFFLALQLRVFVSASRAWGLLVASCAKTLALLDLHRHLTSLALNVGVPEDGARTRLCGRIIDGSSVLGREAVSDAALWHRADRSAWVDRRRSIRDGRWSEGRRGRPGVCTSYVLCVSSLLSVHFAVHVEHVIGRAGW